MYDPITAALIRDAPGLPGLDVERLPETLSEMFAKIAGARVRLRNMSADEAAIQETITFASRLAQTNEALVAVAPDREDRRAAAFVAATAHQLVIQATQLGGERPAASLGQQAISSDLAAMLLFLIGQSTADATEMARSIRSSGNLLEVRLIESLRQLALGNVEEMSNDRQREQSLVTADTLVAGATTALYYRLLAAVLALARYLAGSSASADEAREICLEVRRLSRPQSIDALGRFGGRAVLGFAGPHHLASLLLGVSDTLIRGALVRTTAPKGIDPSGWEKLLRRMARKTPFVWENQALAIEEGYLRTGVSAAVSFPTGAGKSTVSAMKIGATLLRDKKVAFLAPTRALVDQTARDLRSAFPESEVSGEYGDEGVFFAAGPLPGILVMTPEACLTRMHFQPTAFEDVGLLVFDECHLLHDRTGEQRRAIDAMLCLLNFVRLAPDADLLLVSAMMKNTEEMAAWLRELTDREALSLSLDWKPTRQLRGCVVYKIGRLKELHGILSEATSGTGTGSVSAAAKRRLTARPYGLFSIKQTWASTFVRDYALLPFRDDDVQLGVGKWGLTPNAGEVSATLAIAAAEGGIRTLVFRQNITHAAAVARNVAQELGRKRIDLTAAEKDLLKTARDELGDATYMYIDTDEDRVVTSATTHHGQLLFEERRLVELLFQRESGLNVLVATPTLGQGMNLPSELVIIADDSRYDESLSRRKVLEAHELLNAAGRAGRAGQNASGIVVVVPGKVVGFDEEENRIGPRWSTLRQVFGQSDRCLVLDDPLAALLDRVHADSENVESLDRYCLMRLAHPGLEESHRDELDGMLADNVRRSLAAFRRRSQKDDEWVETRLASARRAIGDRSELSEADELARDIAATTGLDEALLGKLTGDIERAELGIDATVLDWSRWLLKWVRRNPGFLTRILRKEDLETQFGSHYRKMNTDAERAEYAIPLVEKLMISWMRGRTLAELQSHLPANARDEKKLVGARKFVVKLAPSLVQMFSVPGLSLGRVRSEREGEERKVTAAVSVLSRCVRRGYDSPELAALAEQLRWRDGRRETHRKLRKLGPYLEVGRKGESWEGVVHRVEKAWMEYLNVKGLERLWARAVTTRERS